IPMQPRPWAETSRPWPSARVGIVTFRFDRRRATGRGAGDLVLGRSLRHQRVVADIRIRGRRGGAACLGARARSRPRPPPGTRPPSGGAAVRLPVLRALRLRTRRAAHPLPGWPGPGPLAWCARLRCPTTRAVPELPERRVLELLARPALPPPSNVRGARPALGRTVRWIRADHAAHRPPSARAVPGARVRGVVALLDRVDRPPPPSRGAGRLLPRPPAPGLPAGPARIRSPSGDAAPRPPAPPASAPPSRPARIRLPTAGAAPQPLRHDPRTPLPRRGVPRHPSAAVEPRAAAPVACDAHGGTARPRASSARLAR